MSSTDSVSEHLDVAGFRNGPSKLGIEMLDYADSHSS
jgi:hypothetical protein